jgi:hypothetical protein
LRVCVLVYPFAPLGLRLLVEGLLLAHTFTPHLKPDNVIRYSKSS